MAPTKVMGRIGGGDAELTDEFGRCGASLSRFERGDVESKASIESKTAFRHHAPKRHIGILTPAAACTYRVWNVATLF
jgi:hypothetical protein